MYISRYASDFVSYGNTDQLRFSTRFRKRLPSTVLPQGGDQLDAMATFQGNKSATWLTE